MKFPANVAGGITSVAQARGGSAYARLASRAVPTVRRSMSPPKRVQRRAKGAIRAGAIRSMQAFTGEVGRATFGGRHLRCELEGTSRSTTRASADGGGSKEVMWPCTYKLQCSLCALNAGNYRISLPKTLRSCWRHYPRLWRALFSLPTVLPPAIRLAERKALDAPFGCSSVVLTTDR